MCFSCIHPYHSRNLHTNIRLFHTGFIGWTESIDKSHAYMTPSISTTTTMKNSMTMKDSMDMHIGDGFSSCSFNAHTLYSHSGIGGLRKNRNKKAETIRIFQESIHLCPLRRFIWPNTKVQALWIIYTLMRLCFCGRTRTLPTLVSIIQRFRGFRKTNIKGYGPEKIEGFPDRIRLANYADASVFAHQRFHGKSGSSGLSESIIDICRKSTMLGIWKNDLMNSEESTKPFSMDCQQQFRLRTGSMIDGIRTEVKKENRKDPGKIMIKNRIFPVLFTGRSPFQDRFHNRRKSI